jgi:hypothetical protein
VMPEGRDTGTSSRSGLSRMKGGLTSKIELFRFIGLTGYTAGDAAMWTIQAGSPIPGT